MADFTIKSNDTLPLIEANLGYQGLQSVPDLSGANVTVQFILTLADDTGEAPAPGVAPKVMANAVIADVPTARVRYVWTRADTNTPGSYLAEWEVTFANGSVQTFPLLTYHTVDILADLDDASGR